MALQCDLTRVASLQWSNSVGQIRHTWQGISGAHHDMSHEGDSHSAAQESLTKINVWYAEQLAYLLGKLAATPEGNGTMLDNTAVLWCNELSKGNSHTHNPMMYVLAGGAGGAIPTGRSLSFPNGRVNNLLVSLCNAFGDPLNTFGNPAYCSGPLAGFL